MDEDWTFHRRARRAWCRASYCACAFFSALGCAGNADIPWTPDLETLESAYDAPSANLMQATRVQNTLARAPDIEQLAASLRATGSLLDGVDDASRAGETRSGEGLRLRGSLELRLRCPGHDAEPVFDAARNGSLTLTLAVRDNAIHRSFAGSAERCALRAVVRGLPIRVSIDGALEVDLGTDVALGSDRSDARVLLSLQGDIEIEGHSVSRVTARFTRDRFEYLYELPDGGTVILLVTADGVGLRDAAGTWYCSVGGDACSAG